MLSDALEVIATHTTSPVTVKDCGNGVTWITVHTGCLVRGHGRYECPCWDLFKQLIGAGMPYGAGDGILLSVE